MLAHDIHIVNSSMHERLTETNWNSDSLSSPSSIASSFEYENLIIDSIKSDLGYPTQDNLMFTDELSLTETQEVENFQQETSQTSGITQCKPNALTQPTSAMSTSYTPPLSSATEDNFISSNVGRYEMYDEPLSSCAPPTSASEALFQQSDSSKTTNNLQFQSEQLDLSNFLQPGYNENDKLGLEQQTSCKDSSLPVLNIGSTPTSDSAVDFQQPRHFNETSSTGAVSTLSAPTPPNFSTLNATSQNKGKCETKLYRT